MVQQVIGYALVAFYFTVLCAVAMYGVHRYALLFLYLRHRKDLTQPKVRYTQLPRITVQLPMFNEDIVAERVIAASCQMDYPRDRFEVQVLDDSTDESADIARQACETWAAKGYPVRYIHRENRAGYKAGALAAGLKTAHGELVAIFDADFVPEPDMLRNVVDYFTDTNIGMVQVRWDHLNRDASLLTKSQAIFLDGHFVIEHTARNRSGRFMHFNGTAGVWRRTTIDDAGGWQHDTLTEDLDLSYRAQMKGWKFLYLPQFITPAELPPEMIGFKQQAHRWTKGSFQTAIKLLPRLLKSDLPARIKCEAFFHLTNTLVYPLMVLLTLLMYPTFFTHLSPFQKHSIGQLIFSSSMFLIATCSAGSFFIFAQTELFGRRAGWRTLFFLPALMALGVGVSINNSKAVIEAIWSAIRHQPSEFVRTPKYGGVGQNSNRTWQSERRPESLFTFKRLWLPLLEIILGVYMTFCLWVAISMFWQSEDRFAGLAGIPFLLIFASGYFYVGFGSLYALYKMQQHANAAARATLEIPIAAAVR